MKMIVFDESEISETNDNFKQVVFIVERMYNRFYKNNGFFANKYKVSKSSVMVGDDDIVYVYSTSVKFDVDKANQMCKMLYEYDTSTRKMCKY